MERFPLIELQGTPHQIGVLHGKLLKRRIERTIAFYQKVFNQPEEEIFEQASHFQRILEKELPDYALEINGIATGASIDSRWIYALNARSEIMTMFISECTAVFNAEYCLLAQNWDWAEALEDLVVLMKITREDGHQILMLTEPGIIGKIGLNNRGLGVTLNFLYAPGILDGVPIHILLRALLDSSDFEEACKKLDRYWPGKGGNIILGSSSGEFVNTEFANERRFQIREGGSFVHTNHYLGDDSLNIERDKLASSLARYSRASQITKETQLNFDGIISLLGDQSNGELPICRPYIEDVELGNLGTVCSIVLDLRHLEFYYTPGHPTINDYQRMKLTKFEELL